MKPITPEEVHEYKVKELPEFVIECVNNLIKKKWNGRSAIIKQKDIVLAIVAVMPNSEDKAVGVLSQEIFDNHWLDIEPAYSAAGWLVTYDSPSYNETYDETFEFRRKPHAGY